MPFEQGEAIPFVQPDPPVRAFYLATVGGGGPANLIFLVSRTNQPDYGALRKRWSCLGTLPFFVA